MDGGSAMVILKLTAFCNLNCSYCYVFNGVDTSFRGRPRTMPWEVAEAAVDRVYAWAARAGKHQVLFSLHGGEPLLAGRPYVARLLALLRDRAPEGIAPDVRLQTNGVLLDQEWLDLLASHDVGIGISLDGPEAVNDRHRVDFAGHGSYAAVRRAVERIQADGRLGWSLLAVIDPTQEGLAIYRHAVELGVQSMDFLLPDHNWESPPARAPGATPYADFLTPIFDEWYGTPHQRLRVRLFESIIALLIGGPSGVDAIGGGPVDEIVVETDGSLEPLDVLRNCGDGFTILGLNVLRDEVEALRATALFQTGLQADEELAPECQACPLVHVCGGGYLPHRYSLKNGFRNQSVYCADLTKLILHVAERVGPDLLGARRRPQP